MLTLICQLIDANILIFIVAYAGMALAALHFSPLSSLMGKAIEILRIFTHRLFIVLQEYILYFLPLFSAHVYYIIYITFWPAITVISLPPLHTT